MDEAQVDILLVDDRPENLLALEAVLGDLNQNLVRATSGAEALRSVLDQNFAVILLDVHMPGMNGFEIASLIRERPQSRHVPIIFITANGSSDDSVSTGYSLGAVDYIAKPFNPDILKAKVRVFIDLCRKSQQIERLNEELERRVQERTEALQTANQELQTEVAERKRIEEEVRRLNAELERRVEDRTTELEEVNRDLTAFSYSVSHDLRAPLRKIDVFSRFLLEDHTPHMDPEGQVYLERIRTASQQMSALIEDMMKLSQVTRNELSREEVNLSELVRELLAEQQQAEPEREVKLNIQPDVLVTGDRRLLQLALHNLLQNAWKYTARQPHPCIEFGTRDAEGPPAYYVKDNGAGFDMAYASRLFAPFQRLHSADEFPGTGIGLAIVDRVIRRHGGHIWAESAEGNGAVFYFTLGE